VLLAFAIDRWYEGRLNKTRMKEFLELVYGELKENALTLEGIYTELVATDKPRIPIVHFRNLAWDSMSNRIALIRKAKLRANIISCYYKFGLQERAFNLYSDLLTAIVKQLPNPYDKLETQAESVRTEITNKLDKKRGDASLLVFAAKVVKEIEDEIERLSDC
jgi:hypothetical protein